MALLLRITDGKSVGNEFIFSQEVVRIGRLPESDLVLYDTGVSRAHCEILIDDGIYTLRDIGSSNGTLLNGVMTTEAQLDDGDMIGVGPITFEVTTGVDAAPTAQKQSVSRPHDEQKRKKMEKVDTVAGRRVDLLGDELLLRRDDLIADPDPVSGPLSVARTVTGSFVAYQRSMTDRLDRMPRRSRLTVYVGILIVLLGGAASAWIVLNRPAPDRSTEVFMVNASTASLRFGEGKVDVRTPDRVKFEFFYEGGLATAVYAAGGIDSGREVEIMVNGSGIGHIPIAAGWTKGIRTSIPRGLLIHGKNALTFDNVYVPGREERWGIAQLKIEQTALPTADVKKARELMELGKASFDTRSVAPQNLFKAIAYFAEADLYLAALEKPPSFREELSKARATAEKVLKNTHNAHTFAAQKAVRFGNLSEAVGVLRDLLRYYPDPDDRRHKEVKARLAELLGKGNAR